MADILNVFISSTFTDLKEERKAAYNAILKAGYHPIGMENFNTGKETPHELIIKLLGKIDVFVLILGGRHGSIEPTTGKSYTQLEYEYAKENNIEMFSLLISEDGLDNKISKLGQKNVREQENQKEYNEFKNMVRTYICEEWTDVKDIKYIIANKLGEVTENKLEKIIENLRLELLEEIKFKNRLLGSDSNSICPNYETIKNILEEKKALKPFISKEKQLFNGIPKAVNDFQKDKFERDVVPHLEIQGLVYTDLVSGRLRIKLTELGKRFMQQNNLEKTAGFIENS